MISLKNIQKVFNSKGIAGLNGVNLEVHKNEILAIVGANGSGKTTLLNIISGNIQPDAGETKISGKIVTYSPIDVKKETNVLEFLIQINQLEVDDEKKLQLARDMAQIFEFTFQLRQKFGELSAGQKQKILLAAHLVNLPEVILLDEPFAHLDPFTRRGILKSLFEYLKNSEITAIWVTHDLIDAFEFSDRVGILNFGKIEQISNPKELTLKPKNLFVAQFIGYKNFLPIKKIDQEWITPWGNIPTSSNFHEAEEAFLIIPESSWFIDNKVSPSLIQNIYSTGLELKLEILITNKKFWVNFKRSWGEIQPGDNLSLSPRLDECLTIPL